MLMIFSLTMSYLLNRVKLHTKIKRANYFVGYLCFEYLALVQNYPASKSKLIRSIILIQIGLNYTIADLKYEI